MFDIITFGSATVDFFAILNQPKKGGEVCFKKGAKENLKSLQIQTGGGGTNTAATFSNFGLKTAFCGTLSRDIFGKLIENDLKKQGVNLSLIKLNPKSKTSVSLVLSPSNGERIILSDFNESTLQVKDIPFSKLKAKWLYLAPLHGESIIILETLLNFACKNKIKIALNPSKEQIRSISKNSLKNVHCLIVNQEEFSLLKEKLKNFSGILIITQGATGCLVKDIKNKKEYIAKARAIKVKEATGAGDAFASGFITGLFLKNDIQYGIRLGLFNSESCIQKIGAKNGLLKKQDLTKLATYNIKIKNI